jgi:hypothetical protein
MRRRESSQKIQRILAPGDGVVEIVTRGDRGAGQKQENLREGIHDPPGFPVIVDLAGESPAARQGKITRAGPLI